MKGLIKKFPKHEDITVAKQNLNRARDYLDKMVNIVQSKCKHEEVFECEYQSLFDSALPPRRLCCNCGLEEEGWGSGYKTLGDATVVVPVTRDELYKQRNL